MNYRDTVFLTVAEQLSFSQAAATLFISQPAVTRHIKALEQHYHTSLFERKGNKIYLTAAGIKVYDGLKNIAQEYNDLEFEVSRLNADMSGSLTLGASSTLAQYVIPQLLASFHKRYPKIALSLLNGNSQDMERLLLDHKVDVALVENETSRLGFSYQSFLPDELLVLTGSESLYAKRKLLKKEDLLSIPLVMREKGSGTLEVIQEAFKRHGLDFEKANTVIHLGSTESIKNFLLAFDGLGIISEKAVRTELYMKTLTPLRVSDFVIPRTFRIVTRQGQEGHAVELFETFLKAYKF